MDGNFGGMDLAQLLQMAGGMNGGGGGMGGLASLLPLLQMQGKKKPWGNMVGSIGQRMPMPQFPMNIPQTMTPPFSPEPSYGMMPQYGGLGFQLPNRPF